MQRALIDHFGLIILDLAKKHNLKPSQVEGVLRSQFEFLLQEMQRDKTSVVKLKHLGKFIPFTRAITRYNNYIAKKNEIDTNNRGLVEKNIQNE